jgi:tryptophanyl-tRNA synthetase
MQSSGKVHLGNLVGALQNWVKLQEKYDCFISLLTGTRSQQDTRTLLRCMIR